MWIDAAGTPHPPAGPSARIVSLVPSITESLFDLGLGERVVGRTRHCIHPRHEVRQVPVVGGTKDVRIDRIRQLEPSHVVVNVDENLAETAEALGAFVPHVVVTHPNAPEDNVGLLRLLGGVFGAAARAEAFVAELAREIAACAAVGWPVERVLYLIWKGPWMTVASDTYIARTLAAVGWTVGQGPGGASGRARYPVIADLDAEVARVDRVLLSSEPYRFRPHHADQLRARFPQTPVDLIDGEMTSWYGTRAIRGLAYLRALRLATLER